uniref:SCII179 protein n=1 Tax=Amanita muscaria TaxID=41956 RepID=O93965_AMAMU|nr:SCII179 protein [Amanita muscaria]
MKLERSFSINLSKLSFICLDVSPQLVRYSTVIMSNHRSAMKPENFLRGRSSHPALPGFTPVLPRNVTFDLTLDRSYYPYLESKASNYYSALITLWGFTPRKRKARGLEWPRKVTNNLGGAHKDALRGTADNVSGSKQGAERCRRSRIIRCPVSNLYKGLTEFSNFATDIKARLTAQTYDWGNFG